MWYVSSSGFLEEKLPESAFTESGKLHFCRIWKMDLACRGHKVEKQRVRKMPGCTAACLEKDPTA